MNLTHRLDRINRLIAGWAITLPAAAATLNTPTTSGSPEVRTTPGTVLDLWCDRPDHNRDIAICKRHGYDCKGRPIPSMSDPTGETVAAHLAATAQFDHALTAIEQACADFDRIIRRHLHNDSPTSTPNTLAPGCELCARVTLHDGRRLWEPPAYDATTVKGILPNAYRLCRWCWDFTDEHGHKPSQAQCEAHARGIRVTRSDCVNCPTVPARAAS